MFLGLTAIESFFAIIVLFALMALILPRKYIWVPMVITVLLMSYLAYRLDPNDSDDLSRYFMQLDYLRDYGHDYLQRCFDENVNGNNWGTYRVCGYYFYFISKLPNNYYMPAVTIFISYGLSFLVIYKAAQRFSVEKMYVLLGCMFFLATYWYYDVCSGVRNGITFTVIVACAYQHLVERKLIPLCYIGYALASFMHSTGIMLVVLVLLAELTLNTSGKFINFMLVFGLITGGAIMRYLSSVSDSEFVDSIAVRAESHQAGSSLYTDTNFLVNISVLVIVALIVFYFAPAVKETDAETIIRRFTKFGSIVMYFMLGCLFSPLIFMRLARWVLPIVGAVMLMVGYSAKDEYMANNDITFVKFYAPLKYRLRANLQSLFNLMIVAYTAVHTWYMCAGSSVLWMHF